MSGGTIAEDLAEEVADMFGRRGVESGSSPTTSTRLPSTFDGFMDIDSWMSSWGTPSVTSSAFDLLRLGIAVKRGNQYLGHGFTYLVECTS